MDKAQIEALLNRIDVWLLIFGIIVVVGVAGESFFGIRHWWNSRKLQTMQRSEEKQREEEIARLKNDSATFELNIANANKGAADANARAAGLEVEALKLRQQLMLQGARENLLFGEKRQALVDALKPFAGQKIDVRYTANAFMVNGKVLTATPLGDDVVGLANSLLGVMKDAKWITPGSVQLYAAQGYGINVDISGNASPSTHKAAEALVKALRGTSLLVFGPQVVKPEMRGRVGTEALALPPPFDENTIVLGVLTHPK